MASEAIQVLVAGNSKTKPMARSLIEGLKPEVEVVHFALSDHIEDDLPAILLRNKFLLDPNNSNVADVEIPAPTMNLTPPGEATKATMTLSPSEAAPQAYLRAQALLLGGAYTDEALSKLRTALAVSDDRNAAAGDNLNPDHDRDHDQAPSQTNMKIPWIKIDPSKSKFSPVAQPAAYIEDAIARFKQALLRLEGERKLDGSDGEIYLV